MGEGDDTVLAGEGVDVMLGEGGDDVLDVGLGLDYLGGEAGADTFRISAGAGPKVIYDYTPGVDRFQLTGFGSVNVNNMLAGALDKSSHSIVPLSDGGASTLWLLGVRPSQVRAGDFLVS